MITRSRLAVPVLAFSRVAVPGLAQTPPMLPEFQVSQDTLSYQSNYGVAMDGAGRFVVTWLNYNPASHERRRHGAALRRRRRARWECVRHQRLDDRPVQGRRREGRLGAVRRRVVRERDRAGPPVRGRRNSDRQRVHGHAVGRQRRLHRVRRLGQLRRRVEPVRGRRARVRRLRAPLRQLRSAARPRVPGQLLHYAPAAGAGRRSEGSEQPVRDHVGRLWRGGPGRVRQDRSTRMATRPAATSTSTRATCLFSRVPPSP